MKSLCKCGCGISLRKDNKTGYQKAHRPCVVCGSLVKRSDTECCSKSCSSKLHWKRNPEMKESRVWNTDRFATREKNKDRWINNLSNACKGKTPWNKDLTGVQIPWNKGLPSNKQPFYGKSHNEDYAKKRDTTNLDRYGVVNTGHLAKSSPRSKKEKLLENLLEGYKPNCKVGSYKPDYLNEDKKHIIEVYGDYWHCNPKIYSADYFNKKLQLTAFQKWNKDKHREEELTKMGYKVTIIWESDLENFIRTQKNVV